jgi:hypothetical protein
VLDELVFVLGRDKTLSLHNFVDCLCNHPFFQSRDTGELFLGDELAGDQSFTVMSN